MRRIVKMAVVMILPAAALLAFSGCQPGAAAPLSTPELKQIIGSGNKNTVVFFLNPQGGPCRSQNETLVKLHRDRGGNFNVAYVSTMRQEDQKAFYDYGVRNLPSLVLVDRRGAIATVFPPGIQSYETLAAALDRTR